MVRYLLRPGVLLGCLASLCFAVSACGSSSKSSSSTATGSPSSTNASSGGSKSPIGIVGFEGPAAQGGPDFIDGMKLATKQINAQGGVNGHPIKLTITQTAGTPQGNAQAYQAAGQDATNVGSFVGASGALAIRGLSDSVKLPAIAASGNDNIITPNKTYIWSNSFGPEYATSSVNYAVKKLGVKKIAIIHYETDFSSQIVPSIQARCKQLGCTVTDVESATSMSSVDQLTPLLTKMKASNPDAYYIESLNPNAMKAAHSLGMFSKHVIAEQWLSTPALAEACGANCETVVFGAHKCRLTNLNDLQPNDPLKAFCIKYVADFSAFKPGVPFELYSIYGRDAVYTYAAAAKKAMAANLALTRDNINMEMEHFQKGDLFTSHGDVVTSPTRHSLVGTWPEAYIDTVIKVNGMNVTYVKAPKADPGGSQP